MATSGPARQARAMSEPNEETAEPNLHPGQRDEGGEGGMATRELAAARQDDDGDEGDGGVDP
jgi:hypothetical protein